MNKSFWHGKKVLITGHSGFKGSWLSIWLSKLGAQVTGYSLGAPTEPSLFKLARVSSVINSNQGDITDYATFSKVVMEANPEIIIHMAAQSLVRKSYALPVETYSTNVMGTVHLLEIARKCTELKVLLIVTSDKCYQNNEWHWGYRENEPMGGFDPYASSKGCAELVTSAYRNSFFPVEKVSGRSVVIASARAGNVIGGGDWAEDRLVPDIMNTIRLGMPVIIRNPNAIRPWQHVLEPLRGYLLLAERMWEKGSIYAEGWNFGPNDADAKSVKWIVDKLTFLWGNNSRWELDSKKNPHESNFLKLDCAKSKNLLGYSPILGLSDALNWIVDWYKSYENDVDVHDITESQIDKYEKIITS